MRQFIERVLERLTAGSPVELVTLLRADGSVPRGPGAVMAVTPEGILQGTVGGGNVEFEAMNQAMELLERGENAVGTFRFIQGDAGGVTYGGTVTLHFQYISPTEQLSVWEELAAADRESAVIWLLRRLDGAAVTDVRAVRRLSLHQEPDFPADVLASRARELDGWFALPMVKAGRVYVFGGGHVSQAVVPAIAAAGFRPVVLDDRPEFARKALFPQAEEVTCMDFACLEEAVTVTPDDYVIVMTRGHQADYQVLTKVLRSGARYLGCIGSRRKLALCRERLLEDGFTAEEYARIHAPIGLNIGAETPAELAVSIAAELIAVRAGLIQ